MSFLNAKGKSHHCCGDPDCESSDEDSECECKKDDQEMEEKIAAARSTLHLNKAMCFCKMELWRDAISDVCLFLFSLYASVMWS